LGSPFLAAIREGSSGCDICRWSLRRYLRAFFWPVNHRISRAVYSSNSGSILFWLSHIYRASTSTLALCIFALEGYFVTFCLLISIPFVSGAPLFGLGSDEPASTPSTTMAHASANKTLLRPAQSCAAYCSSAWLASRRCGLPCESVEDVMVLQSDGQTTDSSHLGETRF